MTSTIGLQTRERQIPAQSGAFLRPYMPSDKPTLFRLLHVVDIRYPGGLSWLNRRLDDVRDGGARCTVAISAGVIVAAMIETPKGQGHVKLSTVWVDPLFRRRGIGTLLFERAIRRWCREGVESAWFTVGLRYCDDLVRVVRPFGFELMGLDAYRYWDDDCELVLGWSPERSYAE